MIPREELEDRANLAIERWNDKSMPALLGNPSFQTATKESMENIAVSCQLLKYNGHGYIYVFDAQGVLEYFDAIDKLEKAWVLSHAR
jgi:hypothetical protein